MLMTSQALHDKKKQDVQLSSDQRKHKAIVFGSNFLRTSLTRECTAGGDAVHDRIDRNPTIE